VMAEDAKFSVNSSPQNEPEEEEECTT